MIHPTSATSTAIALKNLSYIPAFLLGLSMENYTILAVFMLIDVITGLLKAYKVKGGHSIKSFKLQLGIIKKICVIILPLLMVWTGRGVGVDFLKVAHGLLGVLIAAESYSIVGNVYAIYRKEESTEFDAVSFVLKKLQLFIEAFIRQDHSSK